MIGVRPEREIDVLRSQWRDLGELLGLPGDVLHATARDVSEWSIARHLGHVGLVAKAAFRNIRKLVDATEGGSAQGGHRTFLGLFLLTAGWIPRGRARAPASVVPPERPAAEELGRLLAEVREEIDGIAPSIPRLRSARGRIRHFIFGALDAAGWLRFARVHTRHHMKIVRDIRRALGGRAAGAVLSLLLIALPLAGGDAPASQEPGAPDIVRAAATAISTDSTFPGYRTTVLSDGRWIEVGRETTWDLGHPDRLGNAGNTWVSGEAEAEHWIRIDWPRPAAVGAVELWWSLPEWLPRAFRIEVLDGERWVPAPGAGAWLAATGRRSVVPLAGTEVRSLRIYQHPRGVGARSLLAMQEVLAFGKGGPARPRSGARDLSPAEVRRLDAEPLPRNIARIDLPGASAALSWLPGGRTVPVEALADGVVEKAIALEGPVEAIGVEWPIEHSVDGLALLFMGVPPDPGSLAPEVHDGLGWRPIPGKLRIDREPRRLIFSFEPTCAKAFRIRLADGRLPAVTEIEVLRYLPARKDVWPARLVEKGGLRDEVLAAHGDPSFEALALASLPMTPARALLGLKDAPREVGVAWDGTLIGRETLRFSFGEERETLADFRDTVRRTPIDGWRPGTIVEGRAGPLAVRETAFVAPAGGREDRSGLFVRVEAKNAGDAPVSTSIRVEVPGKGPPLRLREGLFLRGEEVALIVRVPGAAADGADSLRIDLTLAPGEAGRLDIVAPLEMAPTGPALDPYRAASFDGALAGFRAYWDRLLAPAATIDVPEERIARMVRAVLAQILVNGDGDIMPYGAEPSVYEGSLFGLEEGYAMLALAEWGLGPDAQRYLDGTYLTREFLRKVEVYEKPVDRHQQYRNGLEPHYAAGVYRLTRDASWIRKHVPLIRDCAEWTIAQRKSTLSAGGEPEGLHRGLLPRWAYGGDIHEVTGYALYGNYSCWRGLADTAWVLEDLGESAEARRLAGEARAYREAIDRAVEGTYRENRSPPFLPLRLYADRPDEQMDYYQLFAGCILDLDPFEKGSRHGKWIRDFLEEDNRLFCLLPRFRRDAGPGGLDAIYGKGYLRSMLREDEIREFLLGFYAFLAFNFDRETFASRETNVLYASDLHVRSRYEVPDMSDPVPCSSAVALGLLRHLLVDEELGGPGEYTGRLRLLPAAPRAWLRDGKRVRVAGAPTHWGPVTVEVRSRAASGRIDADIDPPRRNPFAGIALRLRHPDSRPIRRVTVGGRPWTDFDPAGEWIFLPGGQGPIGVVADY